MNRDSQVYNHSGISTRGGSHEVDPISAPSSSGDSQQLDIQGDDETIQGLVTRPTTNQSTRYSGYPVSNIASTYSSSVPSFLGKLSGNPQSTSQSLCNRINKLVKCEKKVMRQKQDLIKDINSWCNVLPNDDSKKLMYHYIKILEIELDCNEQFIKKQEQINTQLLNVNKREKRTNDLKLKRNKMLVKLRDNENKIGDSPITTLTKENLEELECSVEIVEDQFIRSINLGLKNSIVDYVLTLRDTGGKCNDTSKIFLENYYFTSTKLGPGSDLQRLILQNRLNSTAIPSTSAGNNNNELASGTREVSQDFSKTKYVALSPNKIGKYLDNRYEAENSYGRDSRVEQQQGTIEDVRGNCNSSGHQEEMNRSPTILRVSNKDFNPLQHTNITNELGGPPPTSDVSTSNVHNLHQQDHVIDAAYIINSYNTPGSLAIRPGSQMGSNHEWST